MKQCQGAARGCVEGKTSGFETRRQESKAAIVGLLVGDKLHESAWAKAEEQHGNKRQSQVKY
jgi:hypothetical protein